MLLHNSKLIYINVIGCDILGETVPPSIRLRRVLQEQRSRKRNLPPDSISTIKARRSSEGALVTFMFGTNPLLILNLNGVSRRKNASSSWYDRTVGGNNSTIVRNDMQLSDTPTYRSRRQSKVSSKRRTLLRHIEAWFFWVSNNPLLKMRCVSIRITYTVYGRRCVSFFQKKEVWCNELQCNSVQ
jgi:hypothetical protein